MQIPQAPPVIRQAVDDLRAYLRRKATELKESETRLRDLGQFNSRQRSVIAHALRHPHTAYTIEGHRREWGVVYQTARQDLLDLEKLGLLERRKEGKAFVFYAPADLAQRLDKSSS